MGTFSDQVIINEEIKGVKTYVMPTGVKDVVTISGSMLGGSIHCAGKNSKVSSLVASMLDKGTEKKNKYEISDMLESVGAELNFSSIFPVKGILFLILFPIKRSDGKFSILSLR